MKQQFNVGDTVKYTSPHSDGPIMFGFIKTINPSRFNFCDSKVTGYHVKWADGEEGWISGGNLSLISSDITSVDEAKELKSILESEILRLIQEFNKKTNLEVNDIDLDCYRAIGGGCFYQVAAKVEV